MILLSMPFKVRESQEAESGLWRQRQTALSILKAEQQCRSRSSLDLQELPIKRQRGLLSEEILCTLWDILFLNRV